MERFKCSRRNQTWMCCLFLVCNLSFLVPSQADEDVRISNSEGFDALVGALSGTLDLNEPAKDKTSSSSESLQSILGLEEPADQAHRRRRSIVIRNGPSGRLSVQGLTASQSCDGITVSWIPPSVPYSSMYEYTNSEFKYYNIYRSTSFFNDVTGMQPYATGQHEEALRRVQVTSWTDRYPVAMTTWFYAVTVVDGSGQEGKQVTAQKVQRIPAVQKEGSPVIMMPSLLQGRVLHHSMAYNPNRNEYFVAFDLDINGDNRPDRLYGVRLNPSGVIMDKTILNFTANIPGWVGGEQGWPSAVFNPRHNEFFVLFHFRSMRHFFRKFVILGQRVMSAKTERAAAPTLVVKATSNNGQMKADAKEPKLLYNPQTGGYVASVIIAMPKKDVASLFLDRDGRMQASAQICSFKGHAYEHNLFLDSKRNEFFFTCLVETRGAKMLNVKMENKPYVLVMTKKNATGGHASNIPNPETKNMVSFTTKRDGHVEGYYSEKKDRLMLFWEDTVNGRHVIRKAIVGLSTKFFAREVKQEVCTVTKEVRTPVPLPLPLSGSHYLLWQERDRTSWSIGGQLLKGSFNLANREQRFPVVVHNMRSDMGFVVWQEVFGNQVKLVGRHFQYSSSYTCTPQCTGDQQCYQQNTCAKPITGCSSRPCSHVCKTLPDGRYSCACPKYMHLAADGKTCTGGLETCFGRTPLKDSSNNNLFCGRGAGRRDCPAGSFCHIHPTDRFAVCCKDLLSSYTILIPSNGIVWQASVNPGQRMAALRRLPITQGIMVVAMAHDPVDKRVYWSDVGAQKISRAYLDGRGEETIITTDIVVPDGMVLDTVERRIYWTDIGRKRIERAHFDGSHREELERAGLDKPRGIVLARARRQMYWTDWGANPRIERASMDGGQRKTIVSGALGWPNGIALDEPLSQLYWADAKLDKIETSDLEGRNRRVLVGGGVASHPFSIVIIKNRLFWSDWERSGVVSVDKHTGKDEELIVEGMPQPKGIAVFLPTDPVSLSCPDPGPPDDGSRHPLPRPSGDYASGTSIFFSCNPDFVQIGESKRVCKSDGKWSGEPVRCSARPVFTATPKNTTVSEGDSPLLKCSAYAEGRLMAGERRVKWFKNGIEIPSLSEGHYFTASEGHLVFLVAHYSDRGMYTCKATTPAATIEASAYLSVRGIVRLPECGNPRFETRLRIIGGRQAGKGAHPWQAMLWNKAKKKHFCGATLITNRWLITAAHCVYAPGTMMPSLIKVRLGKHIRQKIEKTEQSYDAEMYKIHPHYSPDSYDSDIALIRLAQPVTFTDYVKPICLPSAASDYAQLQANVSGTISGWGKRKLWRDRVANRLHEATVPIVDIQTCRKAHPDYIVTANMFCAGFENSSRGDACQGDSGGPFSVDNPLPATPKGQHRHVLLGVISWGDGCGKFGKYGVYTRLFNFIDWILNEID